MSTVSKGVKSLLHPLRFVPLKSAEGAIKSHQLKNLPAPFVKFYEEWYSEPEPVHWVPKKGKWERNPVTGETKPIQNQPIPVKYPHQLHKGIWGGEAVVEGLVKKAKFRVPVTRFWVPRLKPSVVYSEILDKYFEVIVTERALRLIDANHGLDNYLLKNRACDIKSLVALKIKRRLLLALADKDFAHDNPLKQKKLLEKYKDHIVPKEEADWIGLSIDEAKAKVDQMNKAIRAESFKPLKHQFRLELINELRAGTSESMTEEEKQFRESTKGILDKFNIFGKKESKS